MPRLPLPLSLLVIASCTAFEPGPGSADEAPVLSLDDLASGAKTDHVPPLPGQCAQLSGTAVLEEIEGRSHVCVDSAECTFVPAGGCATEVSCDYQGAGSSTDLMEFRWTGSEWAAHRTSPTGRLYEFALAAGDLRFRSSGDLDDHHMCLYSNGNVDPIFPVTGACPDLSRIYKVRWESPHLCSKTIRCGLIQSPTDSCVADGFCVFNTGGSRDFRDVSIDLLASDRAVVVGDTTRDPAYPERYEFLVDADLATGGGGADDFRVEYFFGDDAPDDPTCVWDLMDL